MKILAACLIALEQAQDPGTLQGVLRHDPKLEGGVWTLTVDGKVYDLHGDLEGRVDGDRVEVEGVALPHRICIHQVGTFFRVTRIRLLPKDGRCDVPRQGFQAQDSADPSGSDRSGGGFSRVVVKLAVPKEGAHV